MRKPFQKIALDVNVDKLNPYDITCTSAKCGNDLREDDLHCYRPKTKSKKIAHQQDLWDQASKDNNCWACGANLVDWSRVHRRVLSDVSYTVEALNTELIRYVYWHTKIDQKAINHALKKGLNNLRFDAEKRLWKYVAIANYPWDGRQTPKQGNIIYYAQHATACCCRKCMEYWYNIPRGIQLQDNQIDYFVELIMLYLSNRMTELHKIGIKVPSIRSNGKLFVNESTPQLEQPSILLNHQEVQDQRTGEEKECFFPSGETLPV